MVITMFWPLTTLVRLASPPELETKDWAWCVWCGVVWCGGSGAVVWCDVMCVCVCVCVWTRVSGLMFLNSVSTAIVCTFLMNRNRRRDILLQM